MFKTKKTRLLEAAVTTARAATEQVIGMTGQLKQAVSLITEISEQRDRAMAAFELFRRVREEEVAISTFQDPEVLRLMEPHCRWIN